MCRVAGVESEAVEDGERANQRPQRATDDDTRIARRHQRRFRQSLQRGPPLRVLSYVTFNSM